jgi:hypothetical protein
MANPEQFESLLLSRGFKMNISDYDNCDHDNKWTFYVQEDIDSIFYDERQNRIVRSKEFEWEKHLLCEQCLDGYAGVLFCGGHYSNTMMFDHTGKLVTEYNFTTYDPDPEEILHEPESDSEPDINEFKKSSCI